MANILAPRPYPLGMMGAMALNTMRDWMRTVRAMHGYKQSDFAEAIGVSRSTVANYEAGSTIPKDIVTKVMDAFPDAPPPPGSSELSAPSRLVEIATIKMIFVGEVPCSSDWGEPLSATDEIEVDARFGGKNRWAARVRGDSCYPALQQGDLTIWQQDFNAPYGVIVVAQQKEEHGCTVKELAYDRALGRPVLRPINTAHDAPPDGDGWAVIARLVGVIRTAEGPELTWRWDPGLRPHHLVQSG